MARPKQDGLLYFSFDTDFFFADKRIKRVRARLGNNGLLFYIYLLTEIYRNGYYIRWDEESVDNAMDDLDLTEGFIEQAMICLTARELITKIEIVDSRQIKTAVITSPGIQKRYQEAVKGRKRQIEVDSEIWLLREDETASCIKVTQNVSFSEKNPSNSEKNQSNSEKNPIKESKVKESKVKESKVKESKVKESKVNTFCAETEQPPHAPPVISLILNDKTMHDVYESDIDGWKELYPAVDIIQELKKMKGWLDSNPTKRKTKRGINRFINSWLARTQDSGGSRKGQCAEYKSQTGQMLESHYSMVSEWAKKKKMEEERNEG